MDNKAIKELKSDKLKAKTRNDVKELIKIVNCLGRKYLQTQRYNEAIDEHKEELQYSLELRCQLSEAVARRALGECYSEINKYSKALAEHKKYLSLAESLGDQIETQRAFATIGRTHLIRAQELYNNNNEINKKVLFEAKNSFSKALDLCDHLTELKDKELAEMRSRLYLNLGLVFEILGLFKEAMTRLHLSISLTERFHLTEDLFRSQFSLASIYEKNNDLEKSSETFVAALKTAKCLKDKIHIFDALIGNGMVLMRSLKFEESRNQFKKAYKLNAPIVDDHQKAERLLKISSLICDDFRGLSKTNDLEEKISLCDKLGDHFVELKLFEIAINFYKKQLNYSFQCDKSGPQIASIYVSIAQTYADDLKYAEAIQNFQHELNCYQDNPLEETKSLMKIAEMKEYLNREELSNEIIATYEEAVERIANLDKSLLIDILQRYLAFIESHQLLCDKQTELKDRLKVLNSQKTTEIERVEDEDQPDIYDEYDINDISECSTDSEEEEVTSGRPKRMGKTLKKNQLGETPLHRACIEGKVKQVERLLEAKHPVNTRDHCGWTPLHEAVNNGHIDIVRLLLGKGANINDNEGEQTEGITPLHDACSNGHFDIIRLLLKNGAKVTVLNKANETPLDSLRAWKERYSNTEEEPLSGNDLQEFKLIEKELENILKREGFVRKKMPIIRAPPNRIKKEYTPLIRGIKSQSFDDSDDDTYVYKSQNNRNNTSKIESKSGESLDFDDPKVARREYRSSISHLRRKHDSKDKRDNSVNVRPKTKAIPALLDERSMVSGDQWLIDDMNESRKRSSCLDAYDALNKKHKTSDSNTYQRSRKPKQNSVQSRAPIESFDETDVIMSSDESDSGIQIFEPIVDKSQRIKEITNKNIETNCDTNSRTLVKTIQLRVILGDTQNTSLIIPILNKTSNCLWLNKEVQKRYFAKFGVKPVISLATTDGALLSDEDCILDVINVDELKVTANIESWVSEPLDERYKQICNSCGVIPTDDLIKEMQIIQVSGCLQLSNVNLPPQQIKPIFRALQRQNNLREINISCSNIILEDSVEFFNCLPLLPSLQVLNLKCSSMNLQTLEALSSKSCSNLVELNLSFNSFGDYFCKTLIKVVKNFPKLNVIDLTANDFTNSLIDSNEFNDCIKNSNIRTVILDYNPMDSQLIKQFSKL